MIERSVQRSLVIWKWKKELIQTPAVDRQNVTEERKRNNFCKPHLAD